MIRPACLAGLAVLIWGLSAQAHIVYGTKTLLGSTAESDLALRVRILTVDAGPRPTPERPNAGRPAVLAEVLEVLKGRYLEPRIQFVQHGHGVARFEPGDETLLFLVANERTRELGELGSAGAYSWVSLQEHDDEYTLEAATRDSVLAAVRAYSAAGTAVSPETRRDALHRATLGLLTSGDARLAGSALRDLVVAPSLPLITSGDVPALEKVLADPNTSMGVRVSLLGELERRRLVDGPPRWLELLAAEGPSADRVTAIRGASSSVTSMRDPLRGRLIALLSDPDENVASAAAIGLGVRNNEAAVEPLATALSRDSARVRMAAIRGLGGVATPDALRALEITAGSHPDPATQRRARAEVRKRAAQAPTP